MTATLAGRPLITIRRLLVAGALVAAGFAPVALLGSAAHADGPATGPQCDVDGDGQADAWFTSDRNGNSNGIAVDIGQGHILMYTAKNFILQRTGPNSCMMWLDQNGNGQMDAGEVYDLTDKNGDGDFGDAGELTQRGAALRRGR